MEKTETETAIRKLQSHFFGQLYDGANLASVRLDDQHAGMLKKWLDTRKGTLVLSGPVGCGKTYICAALAAWMHDKTWDIYAHKEMNFMSQIKSSFDLIGDSDNQVRYLIDHEFYIYDDLGSTGSGQREKDNTNWKQKVWYILIEERVSSKLPTVITTNFNREQLKDNVGSRSYSRLMAAENCIIEMIDYPDLRKPLIWSLGTAKPFIDSRF